MRSASAAIEAVAGRLDRILFFLGVAALITVLALIGTIEVQALYFVTPPLGLPRDIGGYPTIFWIVALLPMAFVMALVLQLPLIAVLVASLRGGRSETSLGLRRSARTAVSGLFVLAGLTLLLGWLSGPMNLAVGAVLLLEALVVGVLVGRPKMDEVAGGENDRFGARRLLGREVAFVTLLFFGCVAEQLPDTRVWSDMRREIEDVAALQYNFFYENERYPRRLSEAGWAPRNREAVAEFEGDEEGYTATLTLGNDGPYRGFRGEIRCVLQGGVRGGGEPGIDAGRPVCEPPAPRTGRSGDFGLFSALLMDGFVPLFLGGPLVAAGLLLAFGLGVVRPRSGR